MRRSSEHMKELMKQAGAITDPIPLVKRAVPLLLARCRDESATAAQTGLRKIALSTWKKLDNAGLLELAGIDRRWQAPKVEKVAKASREEVIAAKAAKLAKVAALFKK